MLKEEDFLNYLRKLFPSATFTKGNAVISVNIVRTVPIMSCIYIDDTGFYAAKYNRSMGFFSDGMQIKRNEISKIYFNKKFLGDTLMVETLNKLPDGSDYKLKMSMPKFSASKWHQMNLMNLKKSLS